MIQESNDTDRSYTFIYVKMTKKQVPVYLDKIFILQK